MNVGTIAREQGERAEAAVLLDRGLQIAEQYGDMILLAHLFEGLSGLASTLELHERAMRMCGAATALRAASGAPISPAWQRIGERLLEVSRAALGEAAAAAAWKVGHAMPLAEVIGYARASSAESAPTAVDRPHQPRTS